MIKSIGFQNNESESFTNTYYNEFVVGSANRNLRKNSEGIFRLLETLDRLHNVDLFAHTSHEHLVFFKEDYADYGKAMEKNRQVGVSCFDGKYFIDFHLGEGQHPWKSILASPDSIEEAISIILMKPEAILVDTIHM